MEKALCSTGVVASDRDLVCADLTASQARCKSIKHVSSISSMCQACVNHVQVFKSNGALLYAPYGKAWAAGHGQETAVAQLQGHLRTIAWSSKCLDLQSPSP